MVLGYYCVVGGSCFSLGVVYLNVTLLIIALWQYYACCKRSGVTWCALFVVLYYSLWCPVLYVPVQVTCNAFVVFRYTFAPSRCWTSQYCRYFVPLSVALWNDLAYPVFDDVGLVGFKCRDNVFLLACAACSLLCFTVSLSLLCIYWSCGAGVFGLIWCKSLTPSLSCPPYLIIIIIIITIIRIKITTREWVS